LIRARLFRSTGEAGTEVSLEEALAARPGTCAVWLDIEAPTEPEIVLLSEHFRFHPLAIEDCTHLQKRAKFERYNTHGFVVLCALDRTTREDLLDTVPICVFVRAGLVVSVRPKRVTAIERVLKLLDDEPERVGTASERVLHALVDAVVDEFLPLVEDQGDRVDALEAAAALHPAPNVMDGLIRARHDLLQVRRIILPHIEVMRRLVDPDAPEVSGEYRVYFRDVLDHAMVVHDNVSLHLEVANGAMQVHANAVNERLNQVMRFLAVVSTMMLPLTVISGIFGMNFDVIPAAHAPWGFVGAIVLMLACVGGLLLWFRRRGWIGAPPSERPSQRAARRSAPLG
jgi:magnesium transporter